MAGGAAPHSDQPLSDGVQGHAARSVGSGVPATLIVVGLLATPDDLPADWINLTGAETAANIAEIVVNDTGVDVALEVYPPDLDRFLGPDGIGLTVIADGTALEPRVQLQEERQRKDRYSPYAGMIDPRTRREVPGPPADKRVVYVELSYPFHGPPAELELVPPMNAAGVASATIGFLLYHTTVPVVDFRYLSRPETLTLDWRDPWFTTFENRNLVRHHRWPQMTFLYVEPREVRHESLVRVRDLMAWTEDSPDVQRRLSEREQERLKANAGEFFLDRNPVTIDGARARRSGYRAEFLSISPSGLRTVDPGVEIDAAAALIGVSESYRVKALPQSAAVEWQLFDERADKVPTNVVDLAGPYPGFIDPSSPVMTWENYLTDWREPTVEPLPTGNDSWFDTTAIRLAVFGIPEPDTARAVIGELFRRQAIAFLERDTARRRQVQALLIADDAPASLYGELERVFAVPTAGGGVAGVTALGNVEIEQLDKIADGPGFSALASWQAELKGQHWGHVDQRRVRFRTLVDVVETNGNWKLRQLTVLEMRDREE